MDPLERDPKTKQQIKNALYDYIYGPVHRHFSKRIAELVRKNTVLGGHSHQHFVYKGVLYNAESSPPPIRRNRLVPQLRGEMEEFLADQIKLNQQELPFVLGFVNQVLNSSNSLSDYLKVLPESVHSPIQQLMSTCPCRMGILSPERAEQLRLKNEASANLIRQRLVTNLLI
jgi:hypothetical protein